MLLDFLQGVGIGCRETYLRNQGKSVFKTNFSGERFISEEPIRQNQKGLYSLSKTAIINQLRENKNEFGSFVVDYSKGRAVSYEKQDSYVLMSFMEWNPIGSFLSDPNSYKNTLRVKNITGARNMAIEYISN